MRITLQILGNQYNYPTDIATPEDILLLRDEIKEIAENNPCKICGICCNFPDSHISRIFISKFELKRIQKMLPSKHKTLFDRNRIRITSTKDCIFLEDKKCRIQDEKPILCLAYPYYKITKNKFQCTIQLTFAPKNIYFNRKFIKYLLLIAHDTISYIKRRKAEITKPDLLEVQSYIKSLKNKFIPLEDLKLSKSKGASLKELFYFLNVLWLYFL